MHARLIISQRQQRQCKRGVLKIDPIEKQRTFKTCFEQISIPVLGVKKH